MEALFKMTPRQEARMQIIRSHYSKSSLLFERAFEGKLSARKVIHAKCLECSNHVREEINSCTVESCPLWVYRPRFGEDRSKQMRRKTVKAKMPHPVGQPTQVKRKITEPPKAKVKTPPVADWA